MSETTARYVPRVNFGRRLEPPGDHVLHGAGQSPDAFQAYFDVMGAHKPVLYMTYVDLKGDMPEYFRLLAQQLDAYHPWFVLPQIGLLMTGEALDQDPKSQTEHTPQQHYEHEVAAGQWDAQIDAFCQGLQALNRPAFVRIGFEFNGPWFGYQPDAYRAAWIRVVTALRCYHLDDVATVWCYYPLLGLPERDHTRYYPGDDYVDWWSLDLFSATEFTAESTLAFLADAERRGYPVMIGESTPRWVGGIQGGDATWHAWFAPYFEFIRRQPTIKAFCYITWNWTEYPLWRDWGDARIWANETILARYHHELMDPVYSHAPLTSPYLRGDGTT